MIRPQRSLHLRVECQSRVDPPDIDQQTKFTIIDCEFRVRDEFLPSVGGRLHRG